MALPDKEKIKDWLSREGVDRQWLADETDVSKRTVDNWLSSPVEIPAKKLAKIGKLMSRPVIKIEPKAPPMSLVLEVDGRRFDAYNRAATSKGMIIRDWAVDSLNKAAERDAIEDPQLPPPLNTVSFPSSPESAFEIESWGGIAAGTPISSDTPRALVRTDKQYPLDHYALLVFGKSMEPDIPDGSYIVVKQWKESGYPKKGTVVVYNDGHGASLKVYDTRKRMPGEDPDLGTRIPILRSLNKDYPSVQTMEGGRIDAVFVEVLQ